MQHAEITEKKRGRGRPKKNRINVMLALDRDVLDQLPADGTRADTVNRTLRAGLAKDGV